MGTCSAFPGVNVHHREGHGNGDDSHNDVLAIRAEQQGMSGGQQEGNVVQLVNRAPTPIESPAQKYSNGPDGHEVEGGWASPG